MYHRKKNKLKICKFSIPAIKKEMKVIHRYPIGAGAPVYLIGVIEYIVEKLIKESQSYTNGEIKKTLFADKDFRRIFKNFIYEINQSYSKNNRKYNSSIRKICEGIQEFDYINEVINYIVNVITCTAHNLCVLHNKITLSSREIQQAVRIIFLGEHCSKIISNGTRLVTVYTSYH